MKPRVFVTDSSRPSLPSDTAGVLAGGHAFRHRLPAGMPWMPLRLSGAVVARCAFPSLVPVQARVAFGSTLPPEHGMFVSRTRNVKPLGVLPSYSRGGFEQSSQA